MPSPGPTRAWWQAPPSAYSFDPVTHAFEFVYATTGPDPAHQPRGLDTVISVPARQYPTGYEVQVEGGKLIGGTETLVRIHAVADVRTGHGARTPAVSVYE